MAKTLTIAADTAPGAVEQPIRQSRISGLRHWLMAGGPGAQSYGELISEIGGRLRAAGLPLDQFGTYKTMVHPEFPGRLDAWSPKAGARKVLLTGDNLASDMWVGSPAQHCSMSGRELLYNYGEDPAFDERPDQKRLRLRGYSQMFCLPLHSRYVPPNAYGTHSVAAFSTKVPNGFSDHALDAMRDLQALIARVTESFIMHQSTTDVLSTYVGRDAGARVLTGNIVRGDTEAIPAILLFTDLVNFTALSNHLEPEAVVDRLNRHFAALDSAVGAHGGEILKFIGDGALAIFPTPDDRAARTAAAVSGIAAVEDARDAMGADAMMKDITFRAALHLGDVHYGNIGSPRRLDFTVVGPAVNLAARMLEAGGRFGESTVCSQPFARLLDHPPRSLGEVDLKGFDEPQALFGLDSI